MVNGWKIVVTMERYNGAPPMKEYYLVAIADKEKAIAEVRDRERLADAHILIAGQAGPDSLDWLDIREGEILCVNFE